MQVSLCILLLLFTVVTVTLGQDLIFISAEGTLETRVHCEERVNCSGIGTDVFWSFFGLATPIPTSDTRFTESMILSDLEGESVILSTLVLSPAQEDHETLYQCQVQGASPFSASLNVLVDPDPLEIISEISNIDLSNQVIGNNITVGCQVQTCLAAVTMNLLKGSTIVQTESISDNMMDYVNVVFTIPVEADTAGQYACQGLASEGSSNKAFFNITGIPIVPSTSISVVMVTADPVPSSSSSQPANVVSSSVPVTQGSGVSSSSAVVVSVSSVQSTSVPTPTTSNSISIPPTMSPSASPGGGSATVVAEWTLLLSLLLMTIIASLLV